MSVRSNFETVYFTSELLKEKVKKGVVKSTVRFGRVPKREKAKILAAMQSVNARSQEKALEMELEDEAKLMSTVVKAHEDTCDYTKDKIAPLIQRARDDPVYTQCTPQLACPLNPNPHPLQNGNQRVLEDFSERFSPAIRGVVEFAKRIPGFGLLSQDDQVTLLKAGVFEVLLVRLACMFDSRSNTMICLNGQVLKRESLQHTSNARFLMDSMFDFADRLNMLQLMDSEVGLFCAMVVIAADRPGLRNMELVEKIQGKLMQALQTAVSQSHPQSPCLFQELMKKIPDLRTLNTLHSEKLLAFKMEPHVEAAPHHASTSTNMHALYQTHVGHWGTCGMTSHPTASSEDSKGSWEEQDHIVPSPTQHHHHHHHLAVRSGSGASSGWPHDDKDHDLYSSPRSSDTGSYVIDDGVKSPLGSVSSVKSPLGSMSSVKGVDSESVCSGGEMGHLSELHHASGNKGSRKDLHEGGSSSGDESLVVDSPNGKCPFKVRKLDSPTDSGIESGKEMCCNGSNGSRSTSICSSPRSSMEDKVKDILDCEMTADKLETIEDMPVLKRALQAPPLINTNLLMDEAYKPHKKFRALRKDSDSTPTSPDVVSTQAHCPTLNPPLGSSLGCSLNSPLGPSLNLSSMGSTLNLSLASTHSTLVKTLEQGPRMSEQQLKRTDIIHDIIMRGDGQDAATATSRPATDVGPRPPTDMGSGQRTDLISRQRTDMGSIAAPLPPTYGVTATSNGGMVYALSQASPTRSPPSPFNATGSVARAASPAAATASAKNVVVVPPGYYIPQPGHVYPASSSATWSTYLAAVPPGVRSQSPTYTTASSSQAPSASPGMLSSQGRISYVPTASMPVCGSQQAPVGTGGLSLQLQAHLQLGGPRVVSPHHHHHHHHSAASPLSPTNTLSSPGAGALSSPPPLCHYVPQQQQQNQHSQASASPSATASSPPLPRMYYHPRGLASSPTMVVSPQSPRSSPPMVQVSKQVTLTSTTLKPTSPLAGQIVEHFGGSPGPTIVVGPPTAATIGPNGCLVDNQPLNLSKKLLLTPVSTAAMGLDRTAASSVGHLQRVKLEAV